MTLSYCFRNIWRNSTLTKSRRQLVCVKPCLQRKDQQKVFITKYWNQNFQTQKQLFANVH